ncbi:uncharacterized protein BDV14DRAFT_195364 [Aspergillus stella-maris]|uniref:uncharacterized protein n=1 Tax=Aspergillus stella-maris TaxID=1810926 RepID=UPI003CCCC5F8
MSTPTSLQNASVSPYPNDAYTIALIVSCEAEYSFATALLDDLYTVPQTLTLTQWQATWTSYALGTIKSLSSTPHKVVIVSSTGSNGQSSIDDAVIQALKDFPNIRAMISTGTASGVPKHTYPGDKDFFDIRLGDVVIGAESPEYYGGVIDYFASADGIGKELDDTEKRVAPPRSILKGINRMHEAHSKACYDKWGVQHTQINPLGEIIKKALDKPYECLEGKCYNGPLGYTDRLFQPGYKHKVGGEDDHCCRCDEEGLVYRHDRKWEDKNTDRVPHIHHGFIASGAFHLDDTTLRHTLRTELKAKCAEIHAWSLPSDFPVLVIRGIADYGDSHNGDGWTCHAGAAAAAAAREVLGYCYPFEIALEEPIDGEEYFGEE